MKCQLTEEDTYQPLEKLLGEETISGTKLYAHIKAEEYLDIDPRDEIWSYTISLHTGQAIFTKNDITDEYFMILGKKIGDG